MSRLIKIFGNSGPSEIHCKEKIQTVSTEYSNTSKNLSIETMTEDTQPVSLEKNELRNNFELLLQTNLAFLVSKQSNAGTEWLACRPNTTVKVSTLGCDLFRKDQACNFGEKKSLKTFINSLAFSHS